MSERKTKRKKRSRNTKKVQRTEAGWLISTKYTTSIGPNGELLVCCTDCLSMFTPNGIRLRKEAATIRAGECTGEFVCAKCVN